MKSPTKTTAKRSVGPGAEQVRTVDRILGSPLAFVATAIALFLIFGSTFLTNPDRVAPGDDPAFYTWRTEALLSEDPTTLLDIKGPRDVLAGGYRLTSPIIGGLVRRIADVDPLTTTILLTVSLRCLTALLLAAFAYRNRRDPLVFHAVAFGSASLFLTPPFYGYLDNLLCLFFLACALFLLSPSRESWAPRIGLGVLLLAAGMTHPTTLLIFFVVLCAMAGIALIFNRFDFRAVFAQDGPMLIAALAAVIGTYVIWKIGFWGRAASLSEAAVPPPANKAYFYARLELWLRTMRLPLNGPLFLIGAAGLLTAGRKAISDDLTRVPIVWLVPLLGVFGFLAGFSYPYYRFFNTTLAWVLLVGLGCYFVIRLFLHQIPLLAPLGALAVAAVILTNFTANLDLWNDPRKAWLVGNERTDLTALKGVLARSGENRPVVFVIDTAKEDATPIYGDMKFRANISRSGVPHGYLDRAYVYLGSLENFQAGRPTDGPIAFYREISEVTLDNIKDEVDADQDVIAVVAAVFNESGANTGIVTGDEPPGDPATGDYADADIWVLDDGKVTDVSGDELPSAAAEDESGLGHLALVVIALTVLLFPGFLLLRWVLPDAGLAEAFGMIPALSLSALSAVGFVTLAVVRSPLSTGLAWAVVVLTAGIAAALVVTGWGTRERVRR